LKQFSFITTGN